MVKITSQENGTAQTSTGTKNSFEVKDTASEGLDDEDVKSVDGTGEFKEQGVKDLKKQKGASTPCEEINNV